MLIISEYLRMAGQPRIGGKFASKSQTQVPLSAHLHRGTGFFRGASRGRGSIIRLYHVASHICGEIVIFILWFLDS